LQGVCGHLAERCVEALDGLSEGAAPVRPGNFEAESAVKVGVGLG
jgi:hypothetical protein